MAIYLSKVLSDLKQNRTQEKTPFYWSVFYVMCLFCSMYQLKMLNVIIHQQQASFFIRIGKRLDKLRRTTMYFLNVPSCFRSLVPLERWRKVLKYLLKEEAETVVS